MAELTLADLEQRFNTAADRAADRAARAVLEGTKPATNPIWERLLSDIDGLEPQKRGGMVAAFAQDGSYKGLVELEKAAAVPSVVPAEALSVLQPIESLDHMLFGLPAGSAVLGIVPGIITGTVIDGLVSRKSASGGVNILNPLVKGVVGVGAATFLPRFIGSKATMFFVGVLTIQAIAAVLPLDQWIAQIAGSIQRRVPAGLAAGMGQGPAAPMGQVYNPDPVTEGAF